MKTRFPTWSTAFLCLSIVCAPSFAKNAKPSAVEQKAPIANSAKSKASNAIAKKRVERLQRAKPTWEQRAEPKKLAPAETRPKRPAKTPAVGAVPRLQSQAAIVVDQETQQVLFRKNEHSILPMASITKLMTALIVTQARLPMNKEIAISTDDIDTQKGSTSRLVIGSSLSRSEMLHIALMSSENRAANALARTFPGGMSTFVALMNAKARSLGMLQTQYVEPTGLSSQNVSSAKDLAILVKAAHADPVLRQFSTSIEHDVTIGNAVLQYNTTNPLVRDPHWQIGLQKTGYISEAGRCMVMQVKVAGRKLIMVFLDSATRQGRMADARGVRKWLEQSGGSLVANASLLPEHQTQ